MNSTLNKSKSLTTKRKNRSTTVSSKLYTDYEEYSNNRKRQQRFGDGNMTRLQPPKPTAHPLGDLTNLEFNIVVNGSTKSTKLSNK